MKLIGELKEKVDLAETKEEIKKIIEAAGIALTDDELDKVAGGKNGLPDESDPPSDPPILHDLDHQGYSGMKRSEMYEPWEAAHPGRS